MASGVTLNRMSDWVIVFWIGVGVLLGAGLIRGIVRFRSLRQREESQGQAVLALSIEVWRQARRVVVFLVGMTVVLGGVALLVLPGPGTLVVPIGLAILAIEFAWARRWLRRLRVTLHLSAKRSRKFWEGKRDSA